MIDKLQLLALFNFDIALIVYIVYSTINFMEYIPTTVLMLTVEIKQVLNFSHLFLDQRIFEENGIANEEATLKFALRVSTFSPLMD